MKPYSQDLRERVVRACDERRGTRAQIAELFHVSTAWIRRLLQRRRETGSIAARPHAGGYSGPHCLDQKKGILRYTPSGHRDPNTPDLSSALASPWAPAIA